MMASSAAADSQCSGGGRKINPNTSTTAAVAPLRPPEQGLNCPRCDSPNTKFCYYNNYSLTQPRHFCKTCRRYWTKGGALRNVPVGGGCRKSKKRKSSSGSSSSSSRFPSDISVDPITGSLAEHGLKFFNGLSPAGGVDFQLGVLPFSRLRSPSASGVFNTNQLVSFGDFPSPTGIPSVGGASGAATTTATTTPSMLGLNYPIPTAGVYGEMDHGSSAAPVNNSNAHSSIASSIESLSSINQDMHWKLQQQRLQAMFFAGDQAQKESNTTAAALPTPLMESQHEPISFHVPHSSKGGAHDHDHQATTTAWFLDSSYTNANNNNNSNNTSISDNNGNNNGSNWSGMVTWNDMHQFTTLP